MSRDHLALLLGRWAQAQTQQHLYAVNQARLWVEAHHAHAVWHAERAMCSGQPFVAGQTRDERQLDAEVALDGQRIAIEVERTAKTHQRLPAILYGLARRYDAIWYFCPPATQGLLERVIAELQPPPQRQKFFTMPVLEGIPSRRRTIPHPQRSDEASWTYPECCRSARRAGGRTSTTGSPAAERGREAVCVGDRGSHLSAYAQRGYVSSKVARRRYAVDEATYRTANMTRGNAPRANGRGAKRISARDGPVSPAPHQCFSSA